MNDLIPLILSILLYSLAGSIAYFFLSGFIYGAGFEPTRRRNVDLATKLLGINERSLVYDLGSGTGDVVIHLAKKYKAICVGIEIDPLKAWISRIRIRRDDEIRSKVVIERKNFLEADISKADAVYVFLSGGTGIMKKLETKLSRELKPGAKVASYVHSFSNLEPDAYCREVRVYSLAGNQYSSRCD